MQSSSIDVIYSARAIANRYCAPLPTKYEQLKASKDVSVCQNWTNPSQTLWKIPSTTEKSLQEILSAAGKRALGGGIPGMAAMGIQVLSLMWLRTTVNYQYRYGTGTVEAWKTLYAQGGIRRFYRGVGPALIQGPMSRFGDTAANTGMLALLDSYDSTKTLPIGVKTGSASIAAACFRIILMPVDTCKTILQVCPLSEMKTDAYAPGRRKRWIEDSGKQIAKRRPACALSWRLGCSFGNCCGSLSLVCDGRFLFLNFWKFSMDSIIT